MEGMMIRANRLILPFLVFFALGVALQQGCEKAPLTLSPAGVTAFQNHQIAQTLDLVRDIAQDASKTSPPLLSRDIALQVTNWHTAALKTLDARGPNWKNEIQVGLDEVVKNLPAKNQDLLRPYVSLVKTVLAAL
jgi:hypothetical protein